MNAFALDANTNTALIGAVATVLVAAVTTLPAYITRRAQAPLNELRDRMDEVRHHVANDHTTNLREDIDQLGTDLQEVLGVLRGQAVELSGLRDDLRIERAERLAVSSRLDDHVSKGTRYPKSN